LAVAAEVAKVDHTISEPTFFLEAELQAGSDGKRSEPVAYNDGCDQEVTHVNEAGAERLGDQRRAAH
jgi:hypothetical protein